jgi:murein DD-endopeptidase MepM/ murein hydrolase activator NlpD
VIRPTSKECSTLTAHQHLAPMCAEVRSARGTLVAMARLVPMTTKLRTLPRLLSFASLTALLMSGCLAPNTDPELALEEDEELWDEGPPDASGDEETESSSEGLSGAPKFQLPFPCGQSWSGQSRTNHSPQNSLDFNRPDDHGDTVVAAAAGKVTRVANEGNTSYGRWVEIDHGGGYRTRYAHLSKQSVSVGQNVAQGQKIGELGNTGGSSGAHLHYEQRKNGYAQRPVFDGTTSHFFGTKTYKSKNKCGSGGGSTSGVTGTVNTNGISLNVRSRPARAGRSSARSATGRRSRSPARSSAARSPAPTERPSSGTTSATGYISDAYVSTGSDGQVAPTCK